MAMITFLVGCLCHFLSVLARTWKLSDKYSTQQASKSKIEQAVFVMSYLRENKVHYVP